MSEAQRVALEKKIRSSPHLEGLQPPELRVAYDKLCDVTPPAPGSTFSQETANGVRVEIGITPGATSERTILFFHGGGYVVGSLASHRGMVSLLGEAAGMRTVAVDYRLAPEHLYPAAVDDALSAYRWLLDGGTAPGSIAVCGDSAGGGLTLAMLLRARDERLPMPAAAALFSPFVDLTGSGASLHEKAPEDVIVTPDIVHAMGRAYHPTGEHKNPYISPLFADLRRFPPLFIQVGTAECLFDDSLRLARHAGAAGVAVELKIWPRLPHVWQIFAAELDEGAQSLADAGRYIRNHVK